MRASVARYASSARGAHSSRFAGPAAGMRGVDHLPGPASRLLVPHGAAPFRVRVRRAAFAYFPFAELEAVPQNEAERFRGSAACIARELFQPAPLRMGQCERLRQNRLRAERPSLPSAESRGHLCALLRPPVEIPR